MRGKPRPLAIATILAACLFCVLISAPAPIQAADCTSGSCRDGGPVRHFAATWRRSARRRSGFLGWRLQIRARQHARAAR